MKEFMLLIRNQAKSKESMSGEDHQKFLQSCEDYIGDLERQGKLIAAQPLVREGKIISGNLNEWKEIPFDESGEVQVGYYHILAEDMEEAVALAKGNPEFKFTSTARIEVRPVKMKENTTGFSYPKSK